jgi:hypothetical protein
MQKRLRFCPSSPLAAMQALFGATFLARQKGGNHLQCEALKASALADWRA